MHSHLKISVQSFIFDDPSVLLISAMLMPPLLYEYMTLPSTTKEYMAPSMKTPKFLDRLKNHCLVYSFYLGLAGYFNTWVYTTLLPTFDRISNNGTLFGKIFIKKIIPLFQFTFSYWPYEIYTISGIQGRSSEQSHVSDNHILCWYSIVLPILLSRIVLLLPEECMLHCIPE